LGYLTLKYTDCSKPIRLKMNKNDKSWWVLVNILAVNICTRGMNTKPKKIERPLKGNKEVAISIPKY
jgi:hypothetical protein